MGLFSRTTKPTVPSTYLPPPPPTIPTFPPPPPWSPPQPWHQYAPQQPLDLVPTNQHHGPAYGQHDQFVSAEDFNAIQQALSQDTIIDQFDTIITDIDADRWNENDEDAFLVIEEESNTPQAPTETTRALAPNATRCQVRRSSKSKQQKVTIYSKVSLYTNSRLPGDLPPLRLYINTWPLICLAARYSRNVYSSPQSAQEKEIFVSADARLGTKAMVMKSVPCDDKKTLIFAIRGTTFSVRDWCVNLDTSLVSPTGFLDDEGNLCHSGFLKVAKNMIQPIAMRLRALLQENPNRTHCSLLITGHSAGGAIAALIFSHMLSTVKSQLSQLTSCFKRVHCITFGAPPVSLLPLKKPDSPKYSKCQFMSFLNEGDPVVRAEKAYMRSLYSLLSSPPPLPSRNRKPITSNSSYACLQNTISKLDLSLSKLDLTNPMPKPSNLLNCSARPSQPRITFAQSCSSPQPSNNDPTTWPVPMATLSNAGRLVIMRVPPPPLSQKSRNTSNSNLQRAGSNRWEKDNLTRVSAYKVTDEELRGVIFGDPTMHAMEVYLRRVDTLALKAVTARA